ncbi:M23 family metallopeptidase [Cyanobacteria bacterium FACHB-472]|nr:M23 family metallopeptidase [Cyanobacteria bacterium FACHB-472]
MSKNLLKSRPDLQQLGSTLFSLKVKNTKKEFFLLPVAFCLFTLPARALQVQVTPTNPQLGDTLSVVIQKDVADSQSPTVSLKQQNYSTFSIGQNRFRALLPTTPLDKPGRLVIRVAGDGQVREIPIVLRSRSFPVQRITLPPGKAGQGATRYELDRVAAFKKLVTPQKFWNGPFLKPNRGRISSIYGVRRYYNGKFANDYYHRGVDYAGGYGSPVTAPAAGRVALVGRVSQGFRVHGNVIGVDHGQGVTSIFMHLSRIDVKEGDIVKPGQVIGAIGSTGASTGPHLHWGLYVNGLSVDPGPWRNQEFQ